MSNLLQLPNRALRKSDFIFDRQGRSWPLHELDDEELAIANQLVELYKLKPPRHEFRNQWMQLLVNYAEQRKIERSVVSRSALYRIGQDIDACLLIEQGFARPGDYRDELEQVITKNFRTRRAFCEATGLSEDMLSHVLAKRKHLAIDTLADALDKIGYTLHILPFSESEIRSPV